MYLNLGEFSKKILEFLPEVRLSELHFPHVERSYPRNLVVPVGYLGLYLDNTSCNTVKSHYISLLPIVCQQNICES